MVHSCSCGFRGKDPELVEGKCPRCDKDLRTNTAGPTSGTTPTRSRRRR